MPKMKYINKPSVTAAMKAYRLTDEYVAKVCGLSYGSFYSLKNHKSGLVRRVNYDALTKVFRFNDFGQVIGVPFIDEQIEQRKQRKEQLHEHIRQQEKRRLLKKFISNFLYFIGSCGIIAFGLSEFLG
jgi:hypothetical protein